MSITKQGLIAKQGLSEQELHEIEQLAALCNEHDGIELKLNWDILRNRPQDQTHDFLFYENGKLIGFHPLFVFNSREAEVSGMVHPEHRRCGIFRMMVEAGISELQQRGIPNLIYIVHTDSESGKAFVQAMGAEYSFSEYKMVLGVAKVQPVKHPELQLVLATEEHGPFLAKCLAVAFNMPEGSVDWVKFGIPNRRYYLIQHGQEPVGTIAVRVDPSDSSIYGFAITPEHQGRGYGRQILSEIIQGLLAEGQTHIELEVAAKNAHALGLYQSCGFEVASGYDYYTQPIKG